MSGYDRLFPSELMSLITDVIENRTISAGDIISRKQQILPHHKVAIASELAQAVIGALHTLPDSAKQQLITALAGTMSSDIDNTK